MTKHERLRQLQKALDLNQREFADELGLSPASISLVLAGKNWLPKKRLEKLKEKFNVNLKWISTGEGAMFEEKNDMKIVTVTVNESGNENILMVNAAARAGYTLEYTNPQYLQKLPAFHLPSNTFRGGTFRCFEVKGESMTDTILPGSWVIARYVDDWHSIKDGQIYVVVLDKDIVVKRVQNRLKERNQLSLQSDNLDFYTYNVELEEIREVWYVVSELRFQFKRSQHELAQQVFRHESELAEIREDLLKALKLHL